MKVLHVTNLYPYRNAPTYGVFVKEQIDSLRQENLKDVFFINARLKGGKEYFLAIKNLKLLINNYDIIHCHHQFSAFTVLIANPKKKIILSVLGDITKRNLINKVVFHVTKRFSSKVIFKNKLPYNSHKNVLLPNGVNLNFFIPVAQKKSREALGLKNNRNYVLFVSNGSLDNPIKRRDKFLNVLKSINQEKGKLKFKPLYLSNVKRELVPFYFNAANFMILTSDHEGSPNAVKEAMACNLPIISTPVGDVPALLENVTNSYVSSDGTVEDLHRLVKKIDFSKRSNGREKLIKMRLDSESIATRIIQEYESLMCIIPPQQM